uniref:Putative GDSL esterase/lipase-like n=1 Tax=Solanum chacoense TaxID=4108 RepID=A0A0V0H332_SOLCH
MKQLSKSLFVVVIGSNDIINYFKSDSKLPKTKAPQQYVDEMVSTLQGQLKQLHGLGARKFVITSIGSVGCMPLLRFQSANNSNECFQQANFWADKYNQQLQTMLKGLKAELKDINYSFIDTYALLLDIVQNPAIHGFTEVKSACCGLGRLKATVPCTPVALVCPNRNKYVFWDRYHPTEATDRLIIDTTFDGNNKYIFPLNVKQLIAL